MFSLTETHSKNGVKTFSIGDLAWRVLHVLENEFSQWRADDVGIEAFLLPINLGD